MPSDNASNNDPAAAQHRRDPPHSYPHADAFHCHHHHRKPTQAAPSGASQAEAFPCPRCDSKNTKFCYYNNYNLSQPRHFCKSCRRYWTHGGTLRNVPVGGGTRKSTSVSYRFNSSSNKRPRSSPPAVSPCSSSNAVPGHQAPPGAKLQAAGSGAATGSADGIGTGDGGAPGSGFTSQLSTPGSNTFLALGGYAPTLDGLGFGFGRGVWPFPEAGFIEGGMYGSFHGPMVVPAGIEAWHIGAGEGDGGGSGGDGGGGGRGGSTDGEGFAWPELAISMPGQGLK